MLMWFQIMDHANICKSIAQINGQLQNQVCKKIYSKLNVDTSEFSLSLSKVRKTYSMQLFIKGISFTEKPPRFLKLLDN